MIHIPKNFVIPSLQNFRIQVKFSNFSVFQVEYEVPKIPSGKNIGTEKLWMKHPDTALDNFLPKIRLFSNININSIP